MQSLRSVVRQKDEKLLQDAVAQILNRNTESKDDSFAAMYNRKKYTIANDRVTDDVIA